MNDRLARGTALAIALGALVGMLPPLGQAMERGDGVIAALWGLARFFTIWTNALVALVFGLIALRGRRAVAPVWLGAVVLAIMLVGLVFNLMLGQIAQPSWWMRIGDSLHHHAAPLAVPLWWLIFADHGKLGWRAPWLWALYPLGYSGYILVRAAMESPAAPRRYPYFFLDVDALGWAAALAYMAGIAAAFVLLGHGFVALDRWLARRTAG